ncbi:MAG: SUMF1/EgtB/PvdO family nonheme iron enzyme [Bradymonadia bacterium]
MRLDPILRVVWVSALATACAGEATQSEGDPTQEGPPIEAQLDMMPSGDGSLGEGRADGGLRGPDARIEDTGPPQWQVNDAGPSDHDLGVFRSDAGTPDAEVPDLALPDVALSDAEPAPVDMTPIVETPDAEVPDLGVPDMMIIVIPDAELPDLEIPDAEVPDAEVPDLEVPDAEPDPCLGQVELCGDGLDNDCDLVTDETTCAIRVGRPEITWVRIRGGNFLMGTEAGEPLDRPAHQVNVPEFYISKTPVSVAAYRQCRDEEACTAGPGCNVPVGDTAELPIDCVRQSEALEFVRWYGARLPSEAEWEYAARSGGRDELYPWGNNAPTCDLAVLNDGVRGCGRDTLWPVCSKPQGNTDQGLCDMAGLVWEWVADDFGNYADTPVDGSAHVNGGTIGMLRGGSFIDDAVFMRSTRRLPSAKGQRAFGVGFRLVVRALAPIE